MRTLRLARIAVEAEGLRLRRRMARLATRAACALVALAFLLSALLFAHIAAWYWLRTYWDRPYVALAFVGADLLLALILLLVATRSTPDRVELEALAVRQRAMQGAMSNIAWSATVTQLVRVAGRWAMRRRA